MLPWVVTSNASFFNATLEKEGEKGLDEAEEAKQGDMGEKVDTTSIGAISFRITHKAEEHDSLEHNADSDEGAEVDAGSNACSESHINVTDEASDKAREPEPNTSENVL